MEQRKHFKLLIPTLPCLLDMRHLLTIENLHLLVCALISVLRIKFDSLQNQIIRYHQNQVQIPDQSKVAGH